MPQVTTTNMVSPVREKRACRHRRCNTADVGGTGSTVIKVNVRSGHRVRRLRTSSTQIQLGNHERTTQEDGKQRSSPEATCTNAVEADPKSTSTITDKLTPTNEATVSSETKPLGDGQKQHRKSVTINMIHRDEGAYELSRITHDCPETTTVSKGCTDSTLPAHKTIESSHSDFRSSGINSPSPPKESHRKTDKGSTDTHNYPLSTSEKKPAESTEIRPRSTSVTHSKQTEKLLHKRSNTNEFTMSRSAGQSNAVDTGTLLKTVSDRVESSSTGCIQTSTKPIEEFRRRAASNSSCIQVKSDHHSTASTDSFDSITGRSVAKVKAKCEISPSRRISRPRTAGSRTSVREFPRPGSSVAFSRPSSSSTSLYGPSPDCQINGTQKKISYHRLRITKKDIEQSLPRKSFFDCHEKALREAGYDVKEFSREAILARRLAKQKLRETRTRLEAKAFEDKTANGHNGDERQNHRHSLREVASAIKLARKQVKQDMMDEVDTWPFYRFLQLVQQNPDEYKQLIALKQQRHTDVPVTSAILLGLAKVYSSQLPPTGESVSSSLVVQAVHDLTPRRPTQHDTKYNGRPGLKRRSDSQDNLDGQGDGETLKGKIADIATAKRELEEWMGEHTTAEVNRAKEKALSELGEDDSPLNKWWIANKFCRYLRKSKFD